MMEPAELPEMRPLHSARPEWAVTGCAGRERRFLTSIYLNPEDEEVTNHRLLDRWYDIRANEIRYKEYYLDGAKIILVGFGTAGRVALSAVRAARQAGLPVGLPETGCLVSGEVDGAVRLPRGGWWRRRKQGQGSGRAPLPLVDGDPRRGRP